MPFPSNLERINFIHMAVTGMGLKRSFLQGVSTNDFAAAAAQSLSQTYLLEAFAQFTVNRLHYSQSCLPPFCHQGFLQDEFWVEGFIQLRNGTNDHAF